MPSNVNGRTDQPVLAADAAAIGEYELSFHIGEFYDRLGKKLEDQLFVDRVVPLRFSTFDPKQHDLVPMLCTPWSCSTYHGS